MPDPIALGVDYAAPHTADQLRSLKEKGVSFVVRYLTLPQYAWKLLTYEEAFRISQAGLNIVSVYQARNDRIADFSLDKAKRDAEAALKAAHAAGQYPNTAIYFAVDFNARPQDYATIEAYLRTVREKLAILGYKVGVYGHCDLVREMHRRKAADYLWQTYAWSHGELYEHVHLYQFWNGANWCGGSNDLDYCYRDPGWWRIGGVVKPQGEVPIIRQTIRLGSVGEDVREAQRILKALGYYTKDVDGIFGGGTESAVRRYQQDRGLVVDGIVGPKTWAALLAEKTAPMPDWKALYEQEKARREELEARLEAIKRAGGWS